VSPEERSRIMALVTIPGGPESMPSEEFIRQSGVTDGTALGLDLLRDAVDRRDPLDVELALVVCFRFGFTEDHLQALTTLAFADWHQRHEDVAAGLGKIRSPASVDALHRLNS
jgi:hypothetical protein